MAELFQWSDEFSVGVDEIDDQHVELVDLLNQLHAAVREHRGSAAVRGTLDELVDYTRTHFAAEEHMMRDSGYPDYAEHRVHHEALIDQVRALQQKLDSGEASITFELLHFLRVWLMRHIGESDKRFGAWYLEHGSQPEWVPEMRHAMTAHRRWWQFWR
ncbi:bacteriohemerythrin [Pseudothauera rhizosphaerae]|uniref:Bacteriohemerythrin n=1 Tax=Pseudothauera rhizosphaerae TaxID=2565932 RepID=A0A4S4AVZ1_9RHOO|nr:bacteriohemerythrin [Pseudothauera rhizosphaerae]THF64194.1 bacteriohemerythrin [Pseudothauera rhizosphaerae]